MLVLSLLTNGIDTNSSSLIHKAVLVCIDWASNGSSECWRLHNKRKAEKRHSDMAQFSLAVLLE